MTTFNKNDLYIIKNSYYKIIVKFKMYLGDGRAACEVVKIIRTSIPLEYTRVGCAYMYDIKELKRIARKKIR